MRRVIRNEEGEGQWKGDRFSQWIGGLDEQKHFWRIRETER